MRRRVKRCLVAMVVPGAFHTAGRSRASAISASRSIAGRDRPFGVQPDEALLDLLDALERGVPPRLQLPRDMPLGGIDQLVSAGRE